MAKLNRLTTRKDQILKIIERLQTQKSAVGGWLLADYRKELAEVESQIENEKTV